LGLGGFEAVKGRIINANDREELKSFGEICKHLELISSLKKEGKAWYACEEFPFIKKLEESFPIILEEYKRLQETHLVAWPEKYLCQKGPSKVFVLKNSNFFLNLCEIFRLGCIPVLCF